MAWNEYRPGAAFTGTIHSVTVDVGCALIKDSETGMRMILARP